MQKRLGRQTVALEKPAVILAHAAVGGKQEGEGPLAADFDYLCKDSFFGENTWEKAESTMQKIALSRALEKGNFSPGLHQCDRVRRRYHVGGGRRLRRLLRQLCRYHQSHHLGGEQYRG